MSDDTWTQCGRMECKLWRSTTLSCYWLDEQLALTIRYMNISGWTANGWLFILDVECLVFNSPRM